MTGKRIVVVSWAAVGVFAVVAIVDAAGVDALDIPAASIGLGLFLLSLPVWIFAFGLAVVRSARGDDIGVGGLFFLAGSAPADVRRSLLGALTASIVVAAATAYANPFAVLVPMLPLGLAGLWGARHGVYPPRPAAATVPKGGRR